MHQRLELSLARRPASCHGLSFVRECLFFMAFHSAATQLSLSARSIIHLPLSRIHPTAACQRPPPYHHHYNHIPHPAGWQTAPYLAYGTKQRCCALVSSLGLLARLLNSWATPSWRKRISCIIEVTTTRKVVPPTLFVCFYFIELRSNRREMPTI